MRLQQIERFIWRLATDKMRVAIAVLSLWVACIPPMWAATPGPPLVRALESVGMTVADADRAIDFYSRVLSFEKISDMEVEGGGDYERLEGVFGLHARVVRMQLGDESIELTEYLAPKGRPVAIDSHSNDRWFQHLAIITGDMDRAYAWLRENRVQQESSVPQTLPACIKPAASIRAFCFEDPDGHPLEILEFPTDKANPKWHRGTEKLLLGIDQTAIVVANTSVSLAFYRDLLGFRVVGESENYGPEQEHLNSVFGARLRITSLRSTVGPGVELLEYLTPGAGRAMPADEHANDVVDHQTRLLTDDIEGTFAALDARHHPLVSSGIVPFPKAETGLHWAAIVRDPDGHPIELAKQ